MKYIKDGITFKGLREELDRFTDYFYLHQQRIGIDDYSEELTAYTFSKESKVEEFIKQEDLDKYSLEKIEYKVLVGKYRDMEKYLLGHGLDKYVRDYDLIDKESIFGKVAYLIENNEKVNEGE